MTTSGTKPYLFKNYAHALDMHSAHYRNAHSIQKNATPVFTEVADLCFEYFFNAN